MSITKSFKDESGNVVGLKIWDDLSENALITIGTFPETLEGVLSATPVHLNVDQCVELRDILTKALKDVAGIGAGASE